MKTQKPCGHRECTSGKSDAWRTWPNLVTTLRNMATVVLVSLALARHSELLLFLGLASYWVGDTADGAIARLLKQETRTGAAYDILSDRLCVAFFYMAYAGWHHDMLIPIAIFLVNFMLIDNQLSLAFLRWPVMSPNYFYLVDKKIYKLNWSPLAKATNTSLFLIAVVLTHSPWLAGAIALFFLGIKLHSAVLLTKVPYSAENPLSGCIQA